MGSPFDQLLRPRPDRAWDVFELVKVAFPDAAERISMCGSATNQVFVEKLWDDAKSVR